MKYGDLTKEQRWALADLLAEERLPAINKMHGSVVPMDSFYTRYGKRALDILIGSCALVATVPVNLLIAVGTLLTVGRPLMFRQERVGKCGKPFHIIKFRSMTNKTDERGELLLPEERLTKFGCFIRKTSLDELLNFWSVLKGDMSIIGPRPLVPEYTHRYSDRHRARLLVRPGLECPPRDPSVPRTWQSQLENDVWYVEHVSFATDFLMLVSLVRFAFDRKSAQTRSLGEGGTFMGYDQDGIAITLPEVPQEYIDKIIPNEVGNE